MGKHSQEHGFVRTLLLYGTLVGGAVLAYFALVNGWIF